jgi:lysophospholipase L1-like esterase
MVSDPAQIRGPLRALLPRVLKCVAALLLALTTVEVGVRLLGLAPPDRGPNNRLPLQVAVDEERAPGLVTALLPMGAGQVKYPGHGEVPERVVEYRINGDGFRDRPSSYAVPRPPGVFRIACIGDSVTYGTGVPLAATLPKQLEQVLAQRGHAGPIEVMNCGVYGHNTTQQLAWYEFNVARFEPDLVLVIANVNDASGRNVAPVERPDPREVAWIEALGLTSGVWDPGERPEDPRTARTMALRRRSELADLVAHHLYLRWKSAIERQSFIANWQPPSPGIDAVRAALARFTELSERDGFELRVALYPNLEQLDGSYPYEPVTDSLRAICRELGVPFADLLEPLWGRDAYALRAHPHDHHPGPVAHGLVAGWLATWIAESLDFDPLPAVDTAHGDVISSRENGLGGRELPRYARDRGQR